MWRAGIREAEAWPSAAGDRTKTQQKRVGWLFLCTALYPPLPLPPPPATPGFFSSPFHRSLIRAYWPRLLVSVRERGRGAATPIACLRSAVVGRGTVGNYSSNSCSSALVNRARINKADPPRRTTALSTSLNSGIISSCLIYLLGKVL